MSFDIALELIREQGWTVAVHNDYQQDGAHHTFWLFTKGNRCVKGEGRTDQEALDEVRRRLTDQRPVVVLCGSTRFMDVIAVKAWELERDEGVITMGMHLLPQWYTSPDGTSVPRDHLAEQEGVAFNMDLLHIEKIKLADEIYVCNVDGYIGTSTRAETQIAKDLGLNIRWLEEDKIPFAFQPEEQQRAQVILGSQWAEWSDETKVPWSVVHVDDDHIDLSGPGPCRGMTSVTWPDFVRRWEPYVQA